MVVGVGGAVEIGRVEVATLELTQFVFLQRRNDDIQEESSAESHHPGRLWVSAEPDLGPLRTLGTVLTSPQQRILGFSDGHQNKNLKKN